MDQDNHRRLNPSDLKAGDVLLSFGEGPVSEWIVKLTGGDYSHSALFDGERVVEGISKGVVSASLEEHVTAQKGGVDVYRFKSKKGNRLGEQGWSPDPIIIVGKHYFETQTEFSYEQLYLLIPLVLFRRIPGQPEALKKFLRFFLDTSAGLINTVIAGEKEPMTCSELVFRCFSEAVPVPQYTLALEEFSKGHGYQDLPIPDSGKEGAELKELLREADKIARAYFEAKGLNVPDPTHPPKFSPEVIADFVTPADLQNSPNLEKEGCLSEPRLSSDSSTA